MPTSFIATGGQIGYASTAISFDTASMLPTCGEVAGVPNSTATAASSATASETPGPTGRLSGGATAGVVIGVVGLVAVAVIVLVVMVMKRHPSSSEPSVPTFEEPEPEPAPEVPKPVVEAAPGSGIIFKTSLAWDPKMDPKGMIRRFPLGKDAVGRCLPLILAAFDMCYLMKVILPRAVAAVGERLKAGLKGDEHDEAVRRNAIHIYTRPEIYREANRLMRLDPGHNEPGAPLWPFVAILQMAFIKREKDSTGEPFYRGGLISRAELNEVRFFLAAGGEGKILLRGFTSCSREKHVAVKFARKATPTATMARVLYEITLQPASYTQVVTPYQGLPYGPAVPIEYVAKWHKEKEVVLLDGTVLKVAKQDDITEGEYDFECVRIKAEVVWGGLDYYFDLCDRARA
jgi:hypothetical protein